MIKVEN